MIRLARSIGSAKGAPGISVIPARLESHLPRRGNRSRSPGRPARHAVGRAGNSPACRTKRLSPAAKNPAVDEVPRPRPAARAYVQVHRAESHPRFARRPTDHRQRIPAPHAGSLCQTPFLSYGRPRCAPCPGTRERVVSGEAPYFRPPAFLDIREGRILSEPAPN